MTLKRAFIGLLVIAVLLAGGLFTYNTFFAVGDDATGDVAGRTTDAGGETTPAAGVDTIAVPISAGSVSAEGTIVPCLLYTSPSPRD